MKKCLFWLDDIDCILLNQKVPVSIGGASLQLSFWAKTFSENGWAVYAFTHKWRNRRAIKGICFLYIPLIRKTMFILAYLKFIHLVLLNPDLVITRARLQAAALKMLLLFRTKSKFKLLHTMASDFDVDLSREKHDGLESYMMSADYVVAQNNFQQEACRKKLKINVPIIPNIWKLDFLKETEEAIISSDALWVGNFRTIKRPGWFLELAKKNPQFKFVMVGNAHESSCFKLSQKAAETLPNVFFQGSKSLAEVDALMRNTKVLICTSETEGFPNTFLHAWSHGKPIISTVDPNAVFSNLRLGFFAPSIEAIDQKFKLLMQDNLIYAQVCDSIGGYFEAHHSSQVGYNKLLQFLNCTN